MRLCKTWIAGVAVLASFGALAAEWHVDATGGNDAADGRTPETAWQTLDRVNKAGEIRPGDKVLFRRGGEWRGTLFPKSGTVGNPVTYATYGKGPKPILEGSVDASSPSFWFETAPGVWATPSWTPKCREKFWDGSSCAGWSGTFQEGVMGSVRFMREGGLRFVRVACTRRPKARPHLIQVWGPQVDGLSDEIVLKMSVRSTKPFRLGTLRLSVARPPWTTGWSGRAVGENGTEVGPKWRTLDVVMKRAEPTSGAHLHFSIGDILPEGCEFDFIPHGIWRLRDERDTRLSHDVGILICNHGERWGTKKWRKEDLQKPLDYWDDRDMGRVFVKYGDNPGTAFKSVELALTRHVVNEHGCHDVVYDGLTVRYGGAHGFGGGGTANIVIRNCDICWIGGGLQYWQKDAKTGRPLYPVRFGNGIEFWADCRHNLVERNRLWQIYDAALTNQTKDSPKPETDVIWRDNVIWQAEYSFEYWNHDPRSFTDNILFEHNTCVDAGYCWSHAQRPNPNGAHLMFYDNAAPTTNFIVRNNVFCRTTDRSTRMFNDWRAKPGRKDGLTMDGNLYFIPENAVCEYHVNKREKAAGKDIRQTPARFGSGAGEFARYQAEMGMDGRSAYGEPQFVDPAKRDYRLKPGTPGADGATDGGPVGARNMPGLDQDQSSGGGQTPFEE